MKGIRKGESRAKESKPREPGMRKCAKCGRLDFILMRKMGIKSGFTFWNLVGLLSGVPSALDGGELTCRQRRVAYFAIYTDKIIMIILKKELIHSSFSPSDRKCLLLARFGVQCSD
ncbi:hypothetical protein FD755_016915 [Muntiacus reevesi]|uniref:Uncharacterized protein n=2 Tax=Muntiacus TaxID=9885 RepID=A0A5N3XD05_MUNRE|nr:hypothetical protein FD754_009924 [Muntiacus muntjak]KAB0371977.1 hypothetical protein FD755_016915 [Muntiacus reevesi]